MKFELQEKQRRATRKIEGKNQEVKLTAVFLVFGIGTIADAIASLSWRDTGTIVAPKSVDPTKRTIGLIRSVWALYWMIAPFYLVYALPVCALPLVVLTLR